MKSSTFSSSSYDIEALQRQGMAGFPASSGGLNKSITIAREIYIFIYIYMNTSTYLMKIQGLWIPKKSFNGIIM